MASGEGPSTNLSIDTSQRPEPLRIREKKSSRKSSYTSLLPLPSPISPPPRFIAALTASQIITNHHDQNAADWLEEYGIQPSHEAVLVAPGALRLINSLLDQLLFNFVSLAKSTGLSSLRPAISQVLRTKLATEAFVGAEDELHDYLGTDDPALLASHIDPPASGVEWDAVKTWKRTRLRCMVYSSLGDMEEEDEDHHMEQLRLDELLITRRYSRTAHIVEPAVAIYLTAILEYIGERALIFAGQQAYHRLRVKRENENREAGGGLNIDSDISERIIIQEGDMDKVALDRTLGRLWRNWRKSLRSPPTSATMPRSRDSFRSRECSPTSSSSPQTPVEQNARRPSIQEVLDQDHAAAIPLPMSKDDVREIEIPGLVYYNDEKTSVKGNGKSRPKSISYRNREVLLTPKSLPQSPTTLLVETRKRSSSVPTPMRSPYSILLEEQDEPNIDSVAAKLVNESQKELVTDRHDEIEGSSPKSLGREVRQSEIEQSEVEQAHTQTEEDFVADNVFPAEDTNAQEDRPKSKDSDLAEQYYVEKPTIMTSHRVSVGAMSPDGPLSPRPTSIHSIRLIDVPSRSPSRPQPGAAEAANPNLRSSSASSFLRNTSSLSSKSERNSQESIPEECDFTKAAADNQVVPELKSHVSDESAVSTQRISKERTAPILLETEVERIEPPRPTFVLAPAPTTQRRIVNGTPTADYQARNNVYDNTAVLKAPGSADSGVPPLTPLREMMEGAADTSDEASSIAPSHDSRSLSERHINGHTPSISVASVGQSHRNEQHRRPVPPERSTHRTRKDSLQKPNEIVNRSNRSISQSSSATSHSNKLKPMRTSSDYGDEGKGKSFEELIRSDQTIQYTLTPQNMREIESPESPRVANPPNFTNENPTGSTPPRPNTGKSYGSVNRYTGLRSNPPSESPVSKSFQSVSRPASNNATRTRPGAPQARDARIDRESIGDFADFIRSTGPTGLSRPLPRASPTSSGRSSRGGLVRNASATIPRSGAATPVKRSESSAGRTRLLAREAVVPHGDNNSDLIDFIRQGPPSENTKENPRIPRTVAPFRTTMDSDQMAGAIGGRAFESVLPEARSSQTSTNIPESIHSSVNSQSALLNGTNRKAVAPARSYPDFDEEEDMMPKRKTRRVRDPYAIDFSDDEEEELFAMANKKPQRQEESLMDFLNSVPPPPSATPEPSPKSKATLKKKSSRGLMSRFSRINSSSNIAATDIPPPLPNYPTNGNIPRSSTGSRPATHAPQVPPQQPFSTRSGTAHSTASTIKAAPRTNADAYTNNNHHRQFQGPPLSHQQIDKPISYQPDRGNYVSQLDTERKPSSTSSINGNVNGNGTGNGNGNGNRVAQRSYQPREARQRSEGTNDLAAFLMASGPPPSMVRDSPPEPFLLSQNGSSNGGPGGGFSRMFRKKKALGGYA